MADDKDYVVWWIHDDVQEHPSWVSETPEYIKNLFSIRTGHWGVGKTWSRPDLRLGLCVPVRSSPLSDTLCADYGGVIIDLVDLMYVKAFDGIFTDLYLNPVGAVV